MGRVIAKEARVVYKRRCGERRRGRMMMMLMMGGGFQLEGAVQSQRRLTN